MILRASRRRAASVAARETPTAAFRSAAEAARDAPNDREDNEGHDDDSDYDRPFASCRNHTSVAYCDEVRVHNHVPVCLRHTLIPS